MSIKFKIIYILFYFLFILHRKAVEFSTAKPCKKFEFSIYKA